MFETIMRLYVMAMAYDVRSPLPHLFGPPGCGKSTVVSKLGEMLGVNVHTINVSRISPLELEGVQMPETIEHDMKLRLLHSPMWTRLKPGDIVLWDEFLRGFPEVYNGLLDIMTARAVAGFELPKVFMIGASNSTVAYDKALEDRLLHIPVPDIRKSKKAWNEQANHLVSALGLHPEMVQSMEMRDLINGSVAPMYEMLDMLNGMSPGALKGQSIRNLIGQAQLRQVDNVNLQSLISMNNARAMQETKLQYVFLLDGKVNSVPGGYETKAKALVGNPKLTPIQARNLDLNLQLIEMERVRYQKEGDVDDDAILDDQADPFEF